MRAALGRAGGALRAALSLRLRALKQCCRVHSDTSGKSEAWPEVECEVPNEWLLG